MCPEFSNVQVFKSVFAKPINMCIIKILKGEGKHAGVEKYIRRLISDDGTEQERLGGIKKSTSGEYRKNK